MFFHGLLSPSGRVGGGRHNIYLCAQPRGGLGMVGSIQRRGGGEGESVALSDQLGTFLCIRIYYFDSGLVGMRRVQVTRARLLLVTSFSPSFALCAQQDPWV